MNPNKTRAIEVWKTLKIRRDSNHFVDKIFVTTDACKHAIGAFMQQDYEDGRHPVVFITRTLTQHEQNYGAHDLELLGILDTLRTWRYYLYGQKLVVHADHQPLKYLETQDFLTPRQVRWLERISMFDFDIVPIQESQIKLRTGFQDKNERPLDQTNTPKN